MIERDGSNLCGTCSGACCSDMRIALFPNEAAKMQNAGTKIQAWLPAPQNPDFNWAEQTDEIRSNGSKMPTYAAIWDEIAVHATTLKPGQGLFDMDGGCGFLQPDGTCGDYEDRPDACREFTAGSETCNGLRLSLGQIAVPVQLTVKPGIAA